MPWSVASAWRRCGFGEEFRGTKLSEEHRATGGSTTHGVDTNMNQAIQHLVAQANSPGLLVVVPRCGMVKPTAAKKGNERVPASVRQGVSNALHEGWVVEVWLWDWQSMPTPSSGDVHGDGPPGESDEVDPTQHLSVLAHPRLRLCILSACSTYFTSKFTPRPVSTEHSHAAPRMALGQSATSGCGSTSPPSNGGGAAVQFPTASPTATAASPAPTTVSAQRRTVEAVAEVQIAPSAASTDSPTPQRQCLSDATAQRATESSSRLLAKQNVAPCPSTSCDTNRVKGDDDDLPTRNRLHASRAAAIAASYADGSSGLVQPVNTAPAKSPSVSKHQKAWKAATALTDKHGQHRRRASESMLSRLLSEGGAQHDVTCCPITGLRMRDPVIGPDGYTYEREAIEKWIECNGASPKTLMPLEGELIPNRAIAALLARLG